MCGSERRAQPDEPAQQVLRHEQEEPLAQQRQAPGLQEQQRREPEQREPEQREWLEQKQQEPPAQ